MLQFSNLVSTYLASVGTLSIDVAAGTGALFPAFGNGLVGYIRIVEPSTGAKAVYKVTARSTDTLTTATQVSATFTTAAIVSLVASKETFEALMRKRNRLINGCLRLWDYGTTHASPVDGTFVANRWRVGYTGTAGTSTISRVTMTLGEWESDGAPKYLIRWNQTVAGSAINSLRQPIEGVATMAGGSCTVSFLGKCASGTVVATVTLTQNFGTGGAPSGDVSPASQTVTLTTTLKRHELTFTLASIAGKTLGSGDNDHLLVSIAFPSAGTWDVHLGQIQAEATPTASDFERRDVSQERTMAARYFIKTFEDDTAPAQNVGSVTGALAYVCAVAGTAGANGVMWRYPVPMRASPTLTFYSPGAASSAWYNSTDAGASGASSTANASNKSVLVRNAQVATDGAGELLALHATASAEL